MEYVSLLSSPVGEITIKSNGAAVCFIGFEGNQNEFPDAVSELAKHQLAEYFSGERLIFDFPIAQAGTSFQQSVWEELLNIKAGKPITYTALSKRMNKPLAIRAIASANGKNKLMIVVPCHRVIGSNGELVGYAGELWRKKWLLEHEAITTAEGQAVLRF